MLLWSRLVAPVIAGGSCEGPMPLSVGLILWVSICASSIDQGNFQVGQCSGEVRSKRAAGWASFVWVSASSTQEDKKVIDTSNDDEIV